MTPDLLAGITKRGTEHAADVSDVAIASLAEDPKAQIRWYSQQLGIPEDRFGMVKGDIVYMRDDGELQAVAPGSLRKTARGVGPAMPALGGALGTVGGMTVTAPTGPGMALGATTGGFTGAAGGQALREYAANKLMGQDFSPYRVAREGAFDLGASLTGLIIGKGYSKVLATRAGKELARLLKTKGGQAMGFLDDALEEVNQKYGVRIKLTPAEKSNIAELRAQQRALDATPRTAVPMEDFYTGRGQETGKAMEGYLKGLSPVTDPDIAGEGLTQSAGKAMKEIKKRRFQLGSPAYTKSFDEAEPVNIVPVLDAIEDQLATGPRTVKAPLEKLRADLFEEVYDPTTKQLMPQTVDSLEVLQNRVKEALDDDIKAAYKAGHDKAAGRLLQVKKTLLRQMDESSPKFKEARALWGDLSGPVTMAEGGVLPQLSKKTAIDYEYLGTKFLGRSSPSEITRARAHILATDGGEDSWNAAMRGYLEQRWEEAGRVFKSKIGNPALAQGAQPSSFWAEMVGSPSQQKRLQAAMSDDQWEAFSTLMDVFEATGRATNYNSTTVAQALGKQALDTAATGASGVRAAMNPMSIPRRAEEWVAEMSRNANLDDIVRTITNSDSIAELLKVTSRSTPRDKKALAAMKALNLARAEATAGDDQTFAPPAMLQPMGP
jgi:hypothetical protein